MKKLTPLCIIVVVVLSGLGAVAQPDHRKYILKKKPSDFQNQPYKTKTLYVSIALNEANSFLMEQDKPLLPSYSKVYTFPFGTTIQSVTVTPQNIQTQTLSKDIEPTPQYAVIGQTTPPKGKHP